MDEVKLRCLNDRILRLGWVLNQATDVRMTGRKREDTDPLRRGPSDYEDRG